MKADVIVVGLGAVGAASLYQLARRGVDVLGIDRFSPPHDQGSSHGETRITRQGIGEGEDYVPLALRAHEIWRELEAATGEKLLLTCGLAIISGVDGDTRHHGKTDFMRRSQRAAARFGVPHEMLSAAEMAHRYPQFTLTDSEMAYVEPGAGLVYPERCIAAQLSEARRLGARVVTGERVGSLANVRGGVRIVTDRGAYEADQVILSAGAWTPGLVGPALGRLAVQPQALHWFNAVDPDAYAADRCPVFIWMHGAHPADSFYGFPIAPGAATQAVKLATEAFEIITRPDDLERNVPAELSARLYADHVKGRLRGLSPGAIRSAACLYTVTPDADFVIDRAPGNERVLIASACSGHGFKHSAAVGELLARVAAAPATPAPDAFRLGRLQPRPA